MTLSVEIRHQFPGIKLDIAFNTGSGITALFGHSGAGKSTIAQAISGAFTPNDGHIELNGNILYSKDKNINCPAQRRGIGYVFQQDLLFPHFSVQGNLQYASRYGRGANSTKQQDEVIDILGIKHLLQRRPGGLSGGERQRVAIARALLSNPALLVMDEPLSALDDPRKAEILPYIERIRDHSDVPILYITHAVSEIARLADQVVVVERGRVTKTGTAMDVFSDPDIVPQLGLQSAGALLNATIEKHEDDGLTKLKSASGPIYLPELDAEIGQAVRVRVLAHDVMLATKQPENISALNVFHGRVSAIKFGRGPGAIVSVESSGNTILARVTRRSVEALNLQIGHQCYAIIKSVSVAPNQIGHG
jgi:molybdate transport system ATP-binding protein